MKTSNIPSLVISALVICITLTATKTSVSGGLGTVSGQARFKADPTVIQIPADVSKLYFSHVADTSMFPAFQRVGASMIMDSIQVSGETYQVVSQEQVTGISINSFSLASALTKNNVVSLERRFPSSIPYDTLIWDPVDNRNIVVPDISVHYAITFADSFNVDSVVADLQEVGEITSVGPVAEFVDFALCTNPVVSYDEFFPEQWALQDRTETGRMGINIECAWTLLDGNYGNNVVIGIVDNGVDRNHPEFANKFATGGETTMFGDHGTKVAGIATAWLNNALIPPFSGTTTEGITGVAPKSQILVFNRRDQTATLADLDSAISLNPAVINMSWGTNRPNAALHDILLRADAKRIVLVAAAGNNLYVNGWIPPYFAYPAAYDNLVISVAALDTTLSTIHNPIWSNYNDSVDISAPGDSVLTTGINSVKLPISEFEAPDTLPSGHARYPWAWGTSFSAPHVTGLAALAKSYNMTLKTSDIEDLIKRSAFRPGGEKPPKWDAHAGWGALDAYAFISELLDSDPCMIAGDVNGDCKVNVADITYLIARVFSGGPPPMSLATADSSGDCKVNIVDIVYLIDYIFQGGPSPVGCFVSS